MDFVIFKAVLKEEVEKRLGEEYEVRINNIVKNNGLVLAGLTISRNDVNITPTIYIDELFNKYELGGLMLEDAVDHVINVYERNKVGHAIDISFFTDYSKVRNHIVYKLINTEMNRELLEDVPHIPFLDLSIVFCFLISDRNFGEATILIHNAHMRMWHVMTEELYQVAHINTTRLCKWKISDIRSVIEEILETERPYTSNIVNYDDIEYVPMFVLTNEKHVNGAACMLYDNIIQNFAEFIGDDLYILPSSIHDVLLLPKSSEHCYHDELLDIVREVNESEVLPEEVLSNNVYFYSRETGEIEML